MENMANDVKKIAQLNGELTAKASLAESYLEKIVEQAQRDWQTQRTYCPT